VLASRLAQRFTQVGVIPVGAAMDDQPGPADGTRRLGDQQLDPRIRGDRYE
jgi:hypothetical protein